MKIIVINSAKGGVGKTWVTKGLAKSLPGKVVIADMDVTTPNINVVEGVDVHTFVSRKIPTKASISRFIKQLADNTDEAIEWLLIDTPPTMSETYIAIAEQFENARYLFVTTGGHDAIEDTRAGMSFFALRGAKAIGVVQNMLCNEIGLEFDSKAALSIDTVAKFPLSLDTPIEEFKRLSSFVVSCVLEDGTIKVPTGGPQLNDLITEADLRDINAQHLKFYNLATWEYVMERIMDHESINAPAGARSRFDVPLKQLEQVMNHGDSCLVLITQNLKIDRAPRQASIIEVDIVYNNKVSKGLPMFLTKEGVYLYMQEATVIDDAYVQQVLESGGMELNGGEVLLNLYETLYIPRAITRDLSLENEYQTVKAWLKDTGADWSAKVIAYLLYKLEDDDGQELDDFNVDSYRALIESQQDVYNGDFLGHFDKCVALGTE